MASSNSDLSTLNHWGSANRFMHPVTGVTMAKVLPGFYYVTQDDEVINTVLGSCVCACIRDPQAGLGGMNHFMLPGTMRGYDPSTSDTTSSQANRYGQHAMDNLIDRLIKQGCQKNNLEVKLFGGGNMMDIASDVGQENIAFAVRYFDALGIPVISSDLGDDYPRKVNYSPTSGKVKMMKLRGAYSGMVSDTEQTSLAAA